MPGVKKFGTIDRILWGEPKEASVSDSGDELVTVNDERVGLLIVNDSAVNIYLAIGQQAQLNKGIFLAANGGSYEINRTNLCEQAINGIVAATLTGHVTIQEAT